MPPARTPTDWIELIVDSPTGYFNEKGKYVTLPIGGVESQRLRVTVQTFFSSKRKASANEVSL